MRESEEKQRRKDDSGETSAERGKNAVDLAGGPRPSRVPAPKREADSVWVPPSSYEPTPFDLPATGKSKQQQPQSGVHAAESQYDLRPETGRLQVKRPGQTDTQSQAYRQPQSNRAAQVDIQPQAYSQPQTNRPPQSARSIPKPRTSQDWEDSFERDRSLIAKRRRLLDKLIFAVVLVAFIAVLFMLIYDSVGDDPKLAVRQFLEGRNPLQINRQVTDDELNPPSDTGSVQSDGSGLDINLQPDIPAAPLFPLPISSRSYVVWDVVDEKLLYEAAAEEIRDPASLSKVMTALVVLKSDTTLDTAVTLTEEDFAGLYEMDASMAGFVPGETLTVRDLLYGVMLPSGAEASIGLARHIAGSEAEFVVLMNQLAQELGMTKTVFYNSTGLTIDGQSNTTTARDLLSLFREAINYPDFIEIAGTHMRSIAPKTEHPDGLNLISSFTWKFNSDPEHRSNILAGKSGYNGHELSLGTLATVGGKNYIVITLAAPVEDGQSVSSVHDHVVIHNHILSLQAQ